MYCVTMNNIETYQTSIEPALIFASQPVIVQRKSLADKTKPNPVTKVAQRLATVDEDGSIENSLVGPMIHNAGVTLLDSIHAEIDSTNIVDVRARYVASDRKDAVVCILLGYLSRSEEAENEARRQDKKELAQTFA